MAGALGYVHERGIVHRDVKPANILVTPDGQARLGDFGIARLIDVSTLTLDGTTLGTAAYMAPEQLENHQVGPSADIWSLGLVLLECLTGEQVYRGSPGEMMAQRLAGPVPIPADLPVPWKVLLSGMLQDSPDQRLGAIEVADLLDTAAMAAPWEPSAGPATDQLAATQADDLTKVSPRTRCGRYHPGGSWRHPGGSTVAPGRHPPVPGPPTAVGGGGGPAGRGARGRVGPGPQTRWHPGQHLDDHHPSGDDDNVDTAYDRSLDRRARHWHPWSGRSPPG